jgi:hypothetical protein
MRSNREEPKRCRPVFLKLGNLVGHRSEYVNHCLSNRARGGERLNAEAGAGPGQRTEMPARRSRGTERLESVQPILVQRSHGCSHASSLDLGKASIERGRNGLSPMIAASSLGSSQGASDDRMRLVGKRARN